MLPLPLPDRTTMWGKLKDDTCERILLFFYCLFMYFLLLLSSVLPCARWVMIPLMILMRLIVGFVEYIIALFIFVKVMFVHQIGSSFFSFRDDERL